MYEVDVEYIKANRSIHQMSNGIAYYNYEGTHFRVFRSMDDAKQWLENDDDSLIVFETDNEDCLDHYLLDGAKMIKSNCDEDSEIDEICQECWDPDCSGCN